MYPNYCEILIAHVVGHVSALVLGIKNHNWNDTAICSAAAYIYTVVSRKYAPPAHKPPLHF